jgi:hypothetical protein
MIAAATARDADWRCLLKFEVHHYHHNYHQQQQQAAASGSKRQQAAASGSKRQQQQQAAAATQDAREVEGAAGLLAVIKYSTKK